MQTNLCIKQLDLGYLKGARESYILLHEIVKESNINFN